MVEQNPQDQGQGASQPDLSTKEGASQPLTPLQNMELRARQLEDTKKTLETKLSEMEKRLMEEREKVIMASLRSKEEAALSARVETALKEIQEKLRRERREQELEKARASAETRVVEMEKHLSEEHQTWVQVLRDQTAQRSIEAQKIEEVYSARLADAERHWSAEKQNLQQSLQRMKEEMEKASETHAGTLQQFKNDTDAMLAERNAGWNDICAQLEAAVFNLEENFYKRKKLEENLSKKDFEIQAAKKDVDTLREQISRMEQQKAMPADASSQELTFLTTELEKSKKLAALYLQQLQKVHGKQIVPEDLERPGAEGLADVQALQATAARLEKELAEARHSQASLQGDLTKEKDEMARLRHELVRAMAQAETEAARQKALWESERSESRIEVERLRMRAEHLEAQLQQGMSAKEDEERVRRELNSAVTGEAVKSLEEKVASLTRQNDTLAQNLRGASDESKRAGQQVQEAVEKRKGLEEQLLKVQQEAVSQEAALREDMDREYRQTLDQLERDRRKWADELSRTSDQKFREQETRARRDLEVLRAQVNEDFSVLERNNRELQREKDSLNREKEDLKRALTEARQTPRAPQLAGEQLPPVRAAAAADSSAIESTTALWEERIQHIENQVQEAKMMMRNRLRIMDEKLRHQRHLEDKLRSSPYAEKMQMGIEYAHMPPGRSKQQPEPRGFLEWFNDWLDRAVVELHFDE